MKKNYLITKGIISLSVIVTLIGCEKNDSADLVKTNFDINSINEQFKIEPPRGSELLNNKLGLILQMLR